MILFFEGAKLSFKTKTPLRLFLKNLTSEASLGYLKLARNGGNEALLLKAKRDIEATLLVKKESLPKKEIKEIASLVVGKTTINDVIECCVFYFLLIYHQNIQEKSSLKSSPNLKTT